MIILAELILAIIGTGGRCGGCGSGGNGERSGEGAGDP